MGKIILFNMISVDGHFEGPGNDISWHNVDAEFNDFAIDQLNNASALIFGRKTYELMASYWPSPAALNDDRVVASLMNGIPKIVFSKTLTKADWSNTNLYNGNIGNVCLELKTRYPNDIYVFGSADLASEMIRLNLIDEFRFIINPVVLGGGTLMFKSPDEKINLKLIRSKVFESGNVLVVYKRG